MMNEFSIRRASAEDALILARFLGLMLEEMASMGGHEVSKAASAWLEKRVRDNVRKECHAYFVADLTGTGAIPVGLVEALVVSREPVFEPKQVLHISAVYVLRPHRRRGIGRALLGAALNWGRSSGCAVAKLNTLSGNPARSLYEEQGFRVFEMEMTRDL